MEEQNDETEQSNNRDTRRRQLRSQELGNTNVVGDALGKVTGSTLHVEKYGHAQ